MAEHRRRARVAAPRTRPRRTDFGLFVTVLAVLILGLGVLTSIRDGQSAGATPRKAARGVERPPAADAGPERSPVADLASVDLGSLPPEGDPEALAHLASAGEPIYCGAGTKPLVAMTFDDGPGILSPQAIELLRSNGMTATFFTVGKLFDVPAFVDTLKTESTFGTIGDHTWDHVPVDGMTPAELDDQIARTRRAIEDITGEDVVLFRPPLGRRDAVVDDYVRSQGMLQIVWSIDSGDSQGANAKQIFKAVRDHLSPGDIILMHDNRGTTELALPEIVELIRERGLQPVTVEQLLTLDPPSPQQLRSHTCPS